MKKYLAVISSNVELDWVEKFAKENPGDRIVLISHSYANAPAALPGNVVYKTAYDYLSKNELAEIERERFSLAKNWFRFDRRFERSLLFKGIQLGELPLGEMDVFFRENLRFLLGLLNAIQTGQPDAILAGKGTVAGKAVRIAAGKKRFKKVKFFETGKQRLFPFFPNLTTKKIVESKGKLEKILKDLPASMRKKSERKTIFIASRGYLGNLEQKLKETGCFNIFSLDLFLLKQSFNPLTALNTLLGRKKLMQKFTAAFNNYSKSSRFKRNMGFCGMPLDGIFEFKARQLLQLNFPEFVYLIERIDALFIKHRPAALVLWEDSIPFEKICALIAKKHNTPSIVIQHGVFPPPIFRSCFIRGFVPMSADKIAVWGSVFKKILTDNGISPERIVVTGSPKFDSMYVREFDAEKFKRRLGMGERKKLVVCATQPPISTNDPYEMVQHVLNAVRKFPDCFLVVKIHPVEKPGKYREMLRNEKNAAVLQKTSLYELLNAADAVIIHNSTVGFEAMLLGTPVIGYAKKPENIREYKLTSAILKARNEKELGKCLSLLLCNAKKLTWLKEKMRRCSHEINSKCDGKATERIIELIKKTAK